MTDMWCAVDQARGECPAVNSTFQIESAPRAAGSRDRRSTALRVGDGCAAEPLEGLGLPVTIGWRRAGEPARRAHRKMVFCGAPATERGIDALCRAAAAPCPDRVRSLIAAPRALRLGAGRHARSGGVAAGTPARR